MLGLNLRGEKQTNIHLICTILYIYTYNSNNNSDLLCVQNNGFSFDHQVKQLLYVCGSFS